MDPLGEDAVNDHMAGGEVFALQVRERIGLKVRVALRRTLAVGEVIEVLRVDGRDELAILRILPHSLPVGVTRGKVR
jgi:hypothetical protein